MASFWDHFIAKSNLDLNQNFSISAGKIGRNLELKQVKASY
jgi:lipid-binding SYLF domain-containing protein